MGPLSSKSCSATEWQKLAGLGPAVIALQIRTVRSQPKDWLKGT